MTLGQSQWVGAAADLVLTALDARIAGAGQWAVNSANPLDVRTGVVYAGTSTLITGTAGLSVNIAPLHFLSSKATSNGPYQGTIKATEALTVPAAPALGSKRIDLIWVRQEDKNASVSADAATLAKVGITTGTPGSTPAKPALPAGSTEVGTVTWDSTSVVASATNAAQCTLATTCRWTVARGAPIPVRTAAERDDGTLVPYVGMLCQRLDKNGLVQRYDGAAWRGQRMLAKTFSGSISGSAGAFTVAHGCDFTPAIVVPNDVNPSAATGGMAFHIGVGTIGATNLTFVCAKFDATYLPNATAVTIHAVMYEAET